MPRIFDNIINYDIKYRMGDALFEEDAGVANLDQALEAGGLVIIGFAKPLGGTGGYARFIAVAPPDWPYGVSIAEMPGAPLPKQPYPLRRDENGVMRPTP